MSDFYIQNGVLIDYLGPANVPIEIPEGVTEVGENAFWNEKIGQSYCITGAVIPKGVTRVGEYAFYRCGALSYVILPEGLERVGIRAFWNCNSLTEILLPDSVTYVGAGAFSDCKSLTSVVLSPNLSRISGNMFSNCVNLKSVRIPEGVTAINDSAFSGCKKLRSVEIPSSVTYIAPDAFRSCPRLMLIAPHLLLQNAEGDLKISLVLGYCANPERYQGEAEARYAQYAKKYRVPLLAAAEKLYKEEKAAVMAYYDIKPAPRKPRTGQSNPYEKLSEQKKVLLLEETILSGDMEKLEEVLTGCKEFEFMGRALGLACRYGSLEMVRRLVKAGFSFDLGYTAKLTAKYDTYTVYRGFFGQKTVYHHFEYLLTEDDLTNGERIGDLRNIRHLLFTDGERPPIPEAERLEILRYLSHCKQTRCDCHKLLRSAVMEEKTAFADALIEENIKLLDYDLSDCPNVKLTAAANKLLDIAQRQGDKMPVNLPLLKRVMNDTNLVARFLDEGDLPENLNTTELLKSSLNAKTAGTLSLCLERGFLKSKATRDKLIQRSIDEGRTEHTAVLLEYKNRTADFVKERAAEEAKLMKDLTAAPDSLYMLKKLWRYKKQADGTICITGYKGTETEVTVPEKIGQGQVTAIADSAFSPDALRLTEKERTIRKAIQAVTIPNSVRQIEQDAFRNCVGLARVTLPEGLTSLEEGLFYGCGSLAGIIIPEGVRKIEECAFESCTALKTAALPDSLREIGYRAFFHCDALVSVTLPKKLRKIGNDAFAYSGLEEITIPGSVKLIPTNAFFQCSGLREAVVERGVFTLEYGAFQGCGNLARVTLPNSVTEIHQMAFVDCPTELVIRALPGAYAAEFAKQNFYRFEHI